MCNANFPLVEMAFGAPYENAFTYCARGVVWATFTLIESAVEALPLTV